MSLPEVNTLELLLPLLSRAEPWLIMSLLTGIISASSFYLVFGRGFRSLPIYLLVGLAVAPLCQQAASDLAPMPPPLSIGEFNLALIGIGTWLCLTIARLLHL